MQLWTLISHTILEIRIRKLFWITQLLSALAAASMACITFNEDGMEVLFKWQIDAPWFSTESGYYETMISTILSNLLIAYYIGWIGTILGLISTADIFPSLIRRGQIDWLLARPLSRWKLFAGKFLGAQFFMAVTAVVFVVLTFLVVGLRWKIWLPGYLWSILILIFLFSLLYSVCILFGLWSRNGLTSLLLTLAFWFVIAMPQYAYETVGMTPGWRDKKPLRLGLAVAYWVVPNTVYLPRLAQTLMDDEYIYQLEQGDVLNMGTEITPQQRQAIVDFEKYMTTLPWYYFIGSSALFEALVLLLAGWRFSKMDF